MPGTIRRSICLAILAMAAACAGRDFAGSSPGGPYLPPAFTTGAQAQQRTFGQAPPQRGIIKHVIIVMQENRSFNYLFKGYPGATTASSGLNHLGQTVQLKPISLAAPYDMSHGSTEFFEACDGRGLIPGTDCRMDGFDLEFTRGGSSYQYPQYGYAPRKEVELYWEMAHRYVLADDMHTSHLDASFVSHQYIIAAQANHEVDLPFGNWGCGGGRIDEVATLARFRSYGPNQSPCQNYTTLGDLLDDASLSWRFYAPGTSDLGYIWSSYQAIKHIYHKKDWYADVISPPARFLYDVSKGTLANVTWVLPTWETSDHPGALSTMGPQWIASIVNAVGQSRFWDSSAIFIMWDEWGGWYDPVPPPYVDYDGLGMRVALLMISPYAKRGYVTHVQYEHGSILRFAEDAFSLPQLSAADTRANDPAYDAFDFSMKPRAFRGFIPKLPPEFFENRLASTHALDDE